MLFCFLISIYIIVKGLYLILEFYVIYNCPKVLLLVFEIIHKNLPTLTSPKNVVNQS